MFWFVAFMVVIWIGWMIYTFYRLYSRVTKYTSPVQIPSIPSNIVMMSDDDMDYLQGYKWGILHWDTNDPYSSINHDEQWQMGYKDAIGDMDNMSEDERFKAQADMADKVLREEIL